jgi:hypothetical protein
MLAMEEAHNCWRAVQEIDRALQIKRVSYGFRHAFGS